MVRLSQILSVEHKNIEGIRCFVKVDFKPGNNKGNLCQINNNSYILPRC